MSTVVQSYVTIYLVGLLLSDICSLARKRAAIVAIDVSWLCYSCRRSTVPLQTQLNKKSNAPPIVEPESVLDQESGCTTAQWICSLLLLLSTRSARDVWVDKDISRNVRRTGKSVGNIFRKSRRINAKRFQTNVSLLE